MAEIQKNEKQISRQNISYYDEIAADYDAILNKEASNKIIRKKVSDKFTSLVKGSVVLDFGGGTGEDLGWLLDNNYHVIFCEPSVSMCKIAIEKYKNEFSEAKITFFDNDKTNFRNWNETFPFEHKADAILANFAVINCIPDIGLLFKKLALAIKPGGILFALILDSSFKKRLRANLKETIKSIFSKNKVHYFVEYNGQRQLVYLHSNKDIKLAAAGSFDFNDIEKLTGSGFSLLQLVRI
jgi:SAM-dependent methyltransferase